MSAESDGITHDTGKGVAERLRLEAATNFLNQRKKKPLTETCYADHGNKPLKEPKKIAANVKPK